MKPDAAARDVQSAMRKLRHDMRTPLGQIIGYAELLEEEVTDRDHAELVPDLQRIREAARNLLELVDSTFGSGPATASESEAPTVAEGVGDPSLVERTGSLLIVDDEQANCDLLARRLARVGYRVATARGGRQALRHIASEPVDLVLLDVLMPDISGLEVLDAIRRDYTVSELPVIMATALQGSDEVVAALDRGANDYVTKPFDLPVVLARVGTQLTLQRAAREITELAQQLEIRNAFVRRTFGRYVSDEIVANVLEQHEGLELRGEKRTLTILIADLRGFSTLTESLIPTGVVSLLNNHLGTMAQIVQDHDGTVDEFIGDAILAFFGAPIAREDDPERAVACAVAMQLAMESVNERNRSQGLPDVEMGVGIATGDVIVGNLGSQKRTKYTAVGSPVNLAARIESYTLGGEILVDDATCDAARSVIEIERVREVHPKGFDRPVRIHRVSGVGGRFAHSLPEHRRAFAPLPAAVPIRFALLDGKDVMQERHDARIVARSATGAVIQAVTTLAELSEIRIEIGDGDAAAVCYAKVVESPGGSELAFTVRFTSRSPAFDRHLDPAPN